MICVVNICENSVVSTIGEKKLSEITISNTFKQTHNQRERRLEN